MEEWGGAGIVWDNGSAGAAEGAWGECIRKWVSNRTTDKARG